MRFKLLLIILFALLLPAAAVVAMAMAAGSVNTNNNTQESLVPNQVFTYQGELLNDDVPEPGPCDFQFGLWDDPDLGSQLGVTQTLSGVNLYDGRFTVQLNDSHQFGINSFDGSPRYLAIEVDCPSGSGAYVPLSPRQPLTPAPYSYYASSAGSVPWAGITGMPDGFADGVDDDTLYGAGTGMELISTTFQLLDSYQLPQTCDLDQLVEWTGSSWGCVTPDSGSTSYANVVVVAKDGGAFTTVQGALDSIGDASTDNRYLVWVAPGVYSETVDMVSYVDIEGAAQNLTRLQSAGSSTADEATVEAAAHSQLRSLTVENIGGDSNAIAILSEVDDFSLLDVRVFASGGAAANRGIRIVGGLKLNRIINSAIFLEVSGSTSTNYGIQVHANNGTNNVEISDVAVDAGGEAGSFVYGLWQSVNTGRSSAITATNLSVRAENSGSAGSSGAYGVYVSGSGALMNFRGGFSTANAPNHTGHGVYGRDGATIIIRNVSTIGSAYGVSVSGGTAPVSIRFDSSKIEGGTYSAYVTGAQSSSLFVGASLLDGPYDIAASSTMTCVASYDENYGNINGFTACP
jgi:hypothetical protein